MIYNIIYYNVFHFPFVPFTTIYYRFNYIIFYNLHFGNIHYHLLQMVFSFITIYFIYSILIGATCRWSMLLCYLQ